MIQGLWFGLGFLAGVVALMLISIVCVGGRCLPRRKR